MEHATAAAENPALLESRATLAYALALCAATLPVLSCAKTAAVQAVALIVFAIGMCLQMWYLAIPGEYFAHIVLGTMFLTGSRIVLRNGGSLQLPLRLGIFGVLLAIGLLIAEIVNACPDGCKLHSAAHIVIEALIIGMVLPATLEAHLSGGATEGDRRKLRALRAVRLMHDPAVFGAMGLMLMHHKHDPALIAIRFHEAQGRAIMGLGGVMLACGFAHMLLPASSAAATVMRLLHTAVWVFNGLWLLIMAQLFYIWPGRHGLHHVWFPDVDADDAVFADEATAVYLAASIYLSVLMVAAVVLVDGVGSEAIPKAGSAAVVAADEVETLL